MLWLKKPPAPRAQVFVSSQQGQTLTISCQHRDKHRLDVKCHCGMSMLGVTAHGPQCGWLTARGSRWNGLMSPREAFNSELQDIFQAFHADTFEAIVLAEEVMRDLDTACLQWENHFWHNQAQTKESLKRIEMLKNHQRQYERSALRWARLDEILFFGRWPGKRLARAKSRLAKINEALGKELSHFEKFSAPQPLYK